ncbi:hypothetical protein HDU85_007020 [Gaertneriomyces sp. JEL0708]|nr:hypothetical protein HDU85_007020 [Gaertneriomyces sp. JEL0708]
MVDLSIREYHGHAGTGLPTVVPQYNLRITNEVGFALRRNGGLSQEFHTSILPDTTSTGSTIQSDDGDTPNQIHVQQISTTQAQQQGPPTGALNNNNWNQAVSHFIAVLMADTPTEVTSTPVAVSPAGSTPGHTSVSHGVQHPHLLPWLQPTANSDGYSTIPGSHNHNRRPERLLTQPDAFASGPPPMIVQSSTLIQLSERCPDLRHIALSNCPILPDTYIKEIREYASALQYTPPSYFTLIPITALDAIKHLVENCPKLVSFDLRGCEWVTEDVPRFIADACPGLRSLDLRKCSKLSSSLQNLFLSDDIDLDPTLALRSLRRALL